LSSDNSHPNDEGYCLVAERVAKFLLEKHLVEWTPTQSHELTELFSLASELINGIRDKGQDMTIINDFYALAEFLHDEGYLETARWELEKKIIPILTPILENWDDVTAMFTQANEVISIIEQEGQFRDEKRVQADLSRAEHFWNTFDYKLTIFYLQKILDTRDL
jgi:hypothetical protein